MLYSSHVKSNYLVNNSQGSERIVAWIFLLQSMRFTLVTGLTFSNSKILNNVSCSSFHQHYLGLFLALALNYFSSSKKKSHQTLLHVKIQRSSGGVM